MKVWIAYADNSYEGREVIGVSHTLTTAMNAAQAHSDDPIEWEKPDSDTYVEGWGLRQYVLARVEVKM